MRKLDTETLQEVIFALSWVDRGVLHHGWEFRDKPKGYTLGYKTAIEDCISAVKSLLGCIREGEKFECNREVEPCET